ncbi:VWA domain-containing protein [Sediminibacillus dalangtanensis]|uniref:VWA domain-containing protein n=1 Tax=Sediminibacillus dalangtanensis TaxID=2729421 RepID=A0ABX7VS96_9BACI|nr:vWA domain-containing protein [Sediminibacillus dalangtanensis]QTM98475.1 VWA domain-containing protein [Sediminibacillus dalangtanensis]
MKQKVTEIIFLLDRSGSMSGLESDTIGGFNAMMEKQRRLEGTTTVTTVLFDHEYDILWEGMDAEQAVLTSNEYVVRGSTALLDAVGRTILDVDRRHSQAGFEDRPDEVLFVITTDGMENASKEFSYEKVQRLIKRQKQLHDWQFIFLGANIDVAVEASRMGIEEEDAHAFEASAEGMATMYDQVNEMMMEKRSKR